MSGHGAPPPTRNAGTVITQRVLIVAAGFFSCGLLSCVPLFRVAFLRDRWFDWLAAWVSLPLAIACYAVVGSVDETDSRGDLALSVVLLLAVGAIAYFLVVDIRMADRGPGTAGYAAPHAPTVTSPPPGYGHPRPYPANGQTPQPPLPPMGPMAPTAGVVPGPYAGPPQPPAQPPGQPPAPARIEQVRAELDEISDYLRRHDGTSEGGR
ncbi:MULTISPECIES: hypothetical protein [Streptomyces]|jgi:hypothetical protein|uniref:Integral membrane protein n=1 Tax=Streptomyces doudnae TaxID=3075536 RepID=A0ABD5ET77_9ACTN|nr:MULTISPECIES: hypothetical protein [unclassified Streptomyces]MDT0437926.1 hypothetical protein [Streptomyces sp. DSM 41981]MYQ68822.1 hypothetical protein [Streptomyces sp. SID4950]SCE49303.1 hypothetical protein GA0115242_14185 [Streptomyces sp. SolWspMP-5a-2]